MYLYMYLQCHESVDGTIYDFRAQILNSSRYVNFSDLKGMSILFVNVATY